MALKPLSVFINGRFLTQPVTGVQRFAFEILDSLDNYLSEQPGLSQQYKFTCFVPARNGKDTLPDWKNILIKQSGISHGNIWEQIELPYSARKGLLLSLCNIGPLLHFHQIVIFHDASVFAVPDVYTLAFKIKYRIIMWILARTARKVITVSQFSRKELAKYLKIGIDDISLISEGCEHILKSIPDYSTIGKNNLGKKPFILTIGSSSPHKNVKRVIQAIAQFHGDEINLVIAGGKYSKVFKQVEGPENEHVVRLGYVTDSELRALYEKAFCFIFPSLYEGFGLPPLEAMACGCPVLSSDKASSPEIYRDAVLYFDPTSEEGIFRTIKEFMEQTALHDDYQKRGLLLAESYTWKSAAESLFEIIRADDPYSP